METVSIIDGKVEPIIISIGSFVDFMDQLHRTGLIDKFGVVLGDISLVCAERKILLFN